MTKNRQKLVWHTAHVLYRSDVDSRRRRRMHTFQEVFFLVSGFSLPEVRKKAKKLAKQKEHSYKNVYGERVSWRLVRFVAIQEIIERRLADGVEVHHQFLRGLKKRSNTRLQLANK